MRQFSNSQTWDEWLRYDIFSYNIQIQEATGFSPFSLIFGREANIPFSFWSSPQASTYSQYLQDSYYKLDDTQRLARERLEEAKIRSKNYFDKKARKETFNVGDKVTKSRNHKL